MGRLICEVCGQDDLQKEDGLFVCKGCGCKYTAEEAKKLMEDSATVDVSGSTVKIDVSDELKNLYTLARRAVNSNDYTRAMRYYEDIMIKDVNSWEATFYLAYLPAMECTIGQISSAANSVEHILPSTFELIDSYVSEEEKKDAWMDVHSRVYALSHMLFKATYDYVVNNGLSEQTKNNMLKWGTSTFSMLIVLGDQLKECKHCSSVAKSAYEKIVSMTQNDGYVRDLFSRAREVAAERIKQIDPEYTLPSPPPKAETSGGCYVATAVYGSYDCPEVWTLRRYRDFFLAETWYGRVFIHVYYAISPTLVKCFGKTVWFKKIWRGKLDSMVSKLRSQGYADTPYSDRIW